jgi:hypothetical protein
LLAIVVSLGLSAVLVTVLSKPLGLLLRTLCYTGEASQFWVSFTAVMLFLVPLLFAMLPVSPGVTQEAPRVLRAAILANLLGSGLALLFVGLKLSGARPVAPAPGA